jgi:hypothetical protein
MGLSTSGPDVSGFDTGAATQYRYEGGGRLMPRCPICDESAEHQIYKYDSASFAAGPAITICHAADGAYLHVEEEDDAEQRGLEVFE